MKIFWTKEALLRLQEIEEYISRDNPTFAIEFVEKVISTTETID
jgi:plasmid stabilization system protein ParE